MPKQSESQNLLLLSEVLGLSKSCNAIFYASIGEIFLPFTWRALDDSNKEKMFVSRTIEDKDNSLAEDFICIGCQLCGSPLVSENRYGKLKLSCCNYFLYRKLNINWITE